MREIKFRAWSKHLKRYFYNISPLPFGFIASHPILAQPDLVAPTLVMQGIEYEVVIEQYTGLKDKNGKEIYEGDILKCTNHIAPVRYGYYDSYCGMGLSVMGYGFHVSKDERTPFMIGSNCEIIGNVYENPKVLNG